MTNSPALSDVEALVADVADGDLTHGEALAILRKRGLTPDAQHLADAVEQMLARDRFLGRDGDPYEYLATAPRPALDAYEEAARVAEQNTGWAIRELARPAALRRVS